MPISILPISRRRFLAGSLAAGATLLMGDRLFAADVKRDPNRLALFSDTHIAADAAKIDREVNMADHLKLAIEQVLKLDQGDGPPANLLINGDCAHSSGLAGDYVQLLKLLEPISAAGLPIHMTLGNHDSREQFAQSVPYAKLGPGSTVEGAVEKKHVLMLATPLADWFILDSLIQVKTTPGEIGAAQLAWLKEKLDDPKRGDKPAIVMTHHNPVLSLVGAATQPASPVAPASAPASQPSPASATQPATKPATTQAAKISGMLDTNALLDVLVPRKQVKALVYGHTHVWSQEKHDGLHWLNLPAVAYVFKASQPSGWVDCRVTEKSLRLELCCVKDHPQQGQTRTLEWR
jgi:hypothetical protein